MEVMFERVAGIDIGKATLTVCVRTPGERRGRRRSETRTFKTTTGSLLVMRDWLLECGVTIAALESTSTYWKGCFYCLEDHMQVWLLNAAHMHAVPGRKTDLLTELPSRGSAAVRRPVEGLTRFRAHGQRRRCAGAGVVRFGCSAAGVAAGNG